MSTLIFVPEIFKGQFYKFPETINLKHIVEDYTPREADLYIEDFGNFLTPYHNFIYKLNASNQQPTEVTNATNESLDKSDENQILNKPSYPSIFSQNAPDKNVVETKKAKIEKYFTK